MVHMKVIKWETHGTSLPENVSEGDSSKWAKSDRRSRLPSDWQQLRAKVISRAGGRCEAKMKNTTRCTDAGTDVDHITAGDDHSLTNLQLLCKWHHGKKSSYEGNQARPRYTERRPKEAHPGITG